MHSLIIIFAMVGIAVGAKLQPGYTIQSPSSNSLQPGGGVSISVAQHSFGAPGSVATSGGPAEGAGGFSSGVSSGASLGAGGGAAFGPVGSANLGGFVGTGGSGQVGIVGSNVIDGGFVSSGVDQHQQPGVSHVSCAEGEVLHVDGTCVRPIVSRNIFVYAAPEVPQQQGPTPEVPKPKLEYNIVFVRTPEQAEGAEPIIVPPPQQKTLVYVLSKKADALGPQIIEVPAGPGQKPEVYYVNYADGENPTLPGGVDLQQALSAAATTGQSIGGGAGTDFVGGASSAVGGDGGGSIGAVGGSTGIGAGVGASIHGGAVNTGFGGSSISGSFEGPTTGSSFVGGSNTGSNIGGSDQGQGGSYSGGSPTIGNFVGGSPSGGNFVGGSPSGDSFIGTSSTGSNFGSSSSPNSFSSSSSSNNFGSSSGNFIASSNGGSNFSGGNSGGFIPSGQVSGSAPAPQIPSGIYSRPK